jgi:hypothetical protein
MSFLKSKHSGWTWEMTRTPFMGGGGGGGQAPPTQTTSYSTNVPEYARPYVENMLESTQKQIYTDDMAGFRPYRPYSTDPNDYSAGFSPMQQQAQQATAGLQTPGQFGDATTLAGAAGLGSLGAAQRAQPLMGQAGMYGGMGAGYGAQGALAAQQGFGAGQQYAQNVTDPSMMQSYMSPYQQSVTDVAKTAAVREAQMAQNAQNLGAARQGTYGGARQTLAQAEREKNLLSNLSNIQAQGSQSAYDRALQSQQFGANLGLQGLQAGYGGLGLGMQGAQTGLQGVQGAVGAGQYGLAGYGQAGQAASTLGQLGGQQLGAQKEIIGLQNQMGAQQQAQEQNKINQSIQDYAIAQQYPFMQLAQMNAMLRGLPMQTQTTQLYQAQPSALQQGIGLAGAAGTFFGGRNREGGTIKEYREGGITQSYAPGGRVNPESEAVNNVQMQLSSMDVNELREVAAKNPSEQIRNMANELLAQKEIAAAQTQKARMSGIAAAGGGLFDTMGYAGGGILAFQEGGVGMTNPEFGGGDQPVDVRKPMTVDELFREYPGLEGKVGIAQIQDYTSGRSAPPESARAKPAPVAAPAVAAAPKPETKPPAAKPEAVPPRAGPSNVGIGRKSLEQEMAEQERLMGPNTGNDELNAKIAKRLANLSNQASQDDRTAMRNAFIKFGTEASPGGIGVAALKGIETYGTTSDAAKKARESIDLELTKMQADIKKGERSERRGNLDAAAKAFESAENRQLRLAEMQNQLKAAGISASRPGELEKAFALFQKDPVAFEQFIAAKDTNRGNLAAATKNILQAKYPEYAMTAMIPPEKRTKQQNEYLQNAYKDAEATARDMMRKGSASTGSKASGAVDTSNPLLGS